VNVSDNFGCSADDSVNVFVNKSFNLQASADQDSICQGDSLQLNAFEGLTNPGCNNYVVDTVPYNPLPGSGTSVALSSDQVSSDLPLGFNFNFYCNNYNQFRISSNGFLTFPNETDAGCCSGQALPDNSSPNNLIAFAWEDLIPSAGGTIEYFTTGIAPYRALVVNFTQIEHNGGGGNFKVTSQVVLYESTNIIEIHTTIMPSDGGNHTMGIEDLLGNNATVVSGRNSSDWSALNEGIRFTPTNFLSNTLDFNWSPGTATTDSTKYNPQAFPNSSTNFTVSASNGGCQASDNAFVEVSYPPMSQIAHTDSGLTVHFTDSSQNADNVQWWFGDGDTSTNRNPTHAYDSSGSYAVQLLTPNRCGNDIDSTTLTVIPTTLTEHVSGMSSLSI
jgi:hypothetical protein